MKYTDEYRIIAPVSGRALASMYGCMDVWMYVWMHVCMYACMYVCMHAWMYSNRISNDANVRISYEERSGRVLNLNKTCA